MRMVKHNSVFTRIGITIFLVSIVTSLVACLPKLGFPGYISPSPAPSRTVRDGTLSFHEKWRMSNLLIYRRTTSRIYVSGDYLFYVAYKPDGVTHWLEVLDAKNGSLLWKTQELPFPENSLAADQQNLYLALSGKFLAYDISTGRLLWETHEPLLGHTIYWVYPIKDSLLVYSEEDVSPTRREQIIRSYDLQTGLLQNIDRIAIPQNDSFLLRTTSNDYWTNGTVLWAINKETNKRQWVIKIANSLEYQPAIADSTLIFASGIFSEVVGIDNLTGNQIWKYEGKIVSNLAATTGIVYAVRNDAAVIGIDALTGKEVGYIEIEPHVTEIDTRSLAYLVAATEDMIYVYYGDSQELIAFAK